MKSLVFNIFIGLSCLLSAGPTKATDVFNQVLDIGHHQETQDIIMESFYREFTHNYNRLNEDQIMAGFNMLLPYLKKMQDKDDEHEANYVYTMWDAAEFYCAISNYAKAIEYQTEVIEILTKRQGEDSPEVAESYLELAQCYYYIGAYDKTVEFGTRAIENIKLYIPREEHGDYVSALSFLARFYSYLGNHIKAIEFGTKALNLVENGSRYQADLLVELASHYSNFGNHKKAIKLNIKAVNIYQNIFKGKEPNGVYWPSFYSLSSGYATALSNLAHDYSVLGNYKKAIELETEAMKMRYSNLIDDHPDYAVSLRNLSYYYMNIGEIEKSIYMFYECINIIYNHLFQNLSTLRLQERATLWKKESSLFQTDYPQFVYKKTVDSLLVDLYNKSCLFAKGLLLSAETDMRKLILGSGDVEAVKKFEQLQTTRSWLNKLYEKPIAERLVNTDSLENVAEKLEIDLVRMSKTYGDFMHNLKLTWKDVQDKLSDKDVAVEFLSFPVLNSDSTMYIALTVRKGYDTPHMVTLFEENELKSIKSSYYESSELSKLVWGKMADELEGVENIYFSPSGELYNIAIESMPHWADSCMMGDKFNLYRLSSTRELAINRSETKSSGAVVYGGIEYKTDVANMGVQKTEAESLYVFRGFDPDSTNSRGTNWKYLDGTLLEANDIVTILKNNKIPVDSLTGIDATESSLKDLSGKKKRILHISTHGFYWSESAAEHKYERDKLRFLQMSDDRPRYIEDKAMTRSGLLFAGAQNTFDGVEIPAGVEDGVLTAQEISNLDLRGLDLLTLSACQTGLGEIKGDGVFGLQRGFKKAGAQTIMMSLWDVDDDATKDLMTQFYTALVSGKTKRESYNIAQQYVKEHDDEYSYRPSNLRNKRPHWAAFILLDALD